MTKPCNICNSSSFDQVLSLGTLSLGFPVSRCNKNIWKARLSLEICNRCSLIRTVNNVPRNKLKEANLYTSNYKLISKHNSLFIKNVIRQTKIKTKDLIVEIGCGDGSLLRSFANMGYRNIIGIEPSVHKAITYNFMVFHDFFDNKFAVKLAGLNTYPKLIIANYVLELVPEINEFIKNVKKIMASDSYFIFEVPYFLDFIEKKRLDGFAHLRCYWFTINSLIYLFRKHGLHIKYLRHDRIYRGGTLCVAIKKDCESDGLSKSLSGLVKNENKYLNSKHFEQFQKYIERTRINILENIKKLKRKDKSICLYGGGLKSATIVNWLNLTNNEISFTADQDSDKTGRFMPISNIEIKKVNDLIEESRKRPLAVINLALDHRTEVEKLLFRNLAKGSQIINLFPKFESTLI